MLRRVRNLAVVVFLAVGPLASSPPAAAQLDGACAVTFNGVEVDRITTLGSPLELDTTDTLVFAGTSETGTSTARVTMMIGPVTVESRTTTYATPVDAFSASIVLDDVSAYGIGLFRVVGSTDGCLAEVWVRVSGRFPLATLTGLTAVGLTLGGITGQLGAVVSRRRWARSAAALGGIATGVGIAALGQQAGRLQISYPSVAAICLLAGLLGFCAAWWLNPELRAARRERLALTRTTPRSEAAERQTTLSSAGKALPRPSSEQARPTLVPDPPVQAPRVEPLPDASPYWCYVLAPTDVFDLVDHTATVATLVPGTWYLAKRTVSGWAHIVAGEGREGWVAQGAIHRQG